MSMKPWREIAKPHRDVLEGTFKESEFAADISQVASGTATPEYQDAEQFFSRTFITEGMRHLLISVTQRLSGVGGGDPVIQLQTAFGGGKTHTMLAVYHLASRSVPMDKLAGIPPLLDEAGIQHMPTARVAVIDGIKLSPSQPQQHGGVQVNTLWGELAWQLLGAEGYALLDQADQDGVSPGKDVLVQLISKAAPCVILVDELVAFIRQFQEGHQYKGGTFDSNMTFIQALTEAMKSVPNAILLASLPESDLEVGGNLGKLTLDSLEKYFGRIESVWKPVATEEAFEIVRRRLFDNMGDTQNMDQVCKAFASYYREHSDKFPSETQSNSYEERLKQCYPIHPEVFDRLYEDWSTLDKFQRTRGVLQYMAIVIHRLWNSDNKDALIMPGSMPLFDATVRNKSTHYLPVGWEPVLEKEIDGPRSEPHDIDGRDTRFGSIQAARRAARTIFMGSAPSVSEQGVRGIKVDRILLGSAQPGQALGLFEDVLKRLRDRLHYLYSDQDRFWFDTKPNLRREMESRKQRISHRDEIEPLLKDRVARLFGRNHSFSGVHVFAQSVDVPDDIGNGIRLVVLPLSSAYSKSGSSSAFSAAEQILRKRGEQPRQKPNRLIFFAADFDVANRLKDHVRTYLAWKSIVSDINSGNMNLDLYQAEQAKRYMMGSEQALNQLLRETWKWLICPFEEFVRGKPVLKWEAVTVSPAAQNLCSEIENKLHEEEWVVSSWSQIHLKNLLNHWYFKDNIKEVGTYKVWHDCCQYLYLPRLVNESVYKDAVSCGIESTDFFAYASGKEDDKYLGFTFGNNGLVVLDDLSLLIERDEAEVYWQRTKPIPVESSPIIEAYEGDSSTTSHGTDAPAVSPSVPSKKQFYGTVNLDPISAKMNFADIVDEVVQHFTLKADVNVTISVEIQAKSNEGFDESMQRTVKENCSVLRFTSAEFDDE